MKNGATVAAFEREFAQYVGAKYAIALCNGTATLHTALVALGVKPGDKVATTPLTMSATSIAILQAGAVPVYCDVDPKTWLMASKGCFDGDDAAIPVDLYGLSAVTDSDISPIILGPGWKPSANNDIAGAIIHTADWPMKVVTDAAQTLRKHESKSPFTSFTSYSFQASKILALGEGGMLVTDSEELATKAREFSSLGYRMKADQPRIDPSVLKSPDYERHHSLGWNYRMNDATAVEGLRVLPYAFRVMLGTRRSAASMYRDAIKGCSWITAQHVPEGWTHDYWTFAIALESKELWKPFTEAVVRHGGEMPYGCWKLTYQEPAFRNTAPPAYLSVGKYATGLCPVAENLQPRLVQLQTNCLSSTERNAKAVRLAIRDIENNRAVTAMFRLAASHQMGHRTDWVPIPDATGTPCS